MSEICKNHLRYTSALYTQFPIEYARSKIGNNFFADA